MSEEPGSSADPDRDLMEGLFFDLGIFGDHSSAFGGARFRSAPGLTVQQTLSPGPIASAVCGALPSATTELSFGDDPLSELTEKCIHHVHGESFTFLINTVVRGSVWV